MTKDQQIISDSVEVVIDTIVSTVPGLNIAWGLSKALYGAGLKLRQQRALEWVDMVQKNPSIFTTTLLQDPAFQDGFVYALEQYIRERNANKREKMCRLFLGFATAKEKDNFELERFYTTLSILDEYSFGCLSMVDVRTPNSYQVYDDQRDIESVRTLIHAGILVLDTTSRMSPVNAPNVFTTAYGRRFIHYLKS